MPRALKVLFAHLDLLFYLGVLKREKKKVREEVSKKVRKRGRERKREVEG